MNRLIEDATEGFKAWTVKVAKGGAEAILKEVSGRGKASGSDVLVMNGDLVFGADHIRSALFHAKRAIAEKRNASDSVAMETLLYASGERQLATAIKKMSVGIDTVNVAVACLSNAGFHAEPGWEEMSGSLSSVDITKLKAFGISDRELGTITTSKVTELVLEKVAAVDILKK